MVYTFISNLSFPLKFFLAMASPFIAILILHIIYTVIKDITMTIVTGLSMTYNYIFKSSKRSEIRATLSDLWNNPRINSYEGESPLQARDYVNPNLPTFHSFNNDPSQPRFHSFNKDGVAIYVETIEISGHTFPHYFWSPDGIRRLSLDENGGTRFKA
jgi:hypothetical protein